MEHPNAPGTPGPRRTRSAGRMSPPSDPIGEGEHLASPTENPSSSDPPRHGTPPVPLLRPAQGAWDRAYGFGKTQGQTRPASQNKDTVAPVSTATQTRSADPEPALSPPAHTRSKDTSSKWRDPGPSTATSSYAGQDHSARVTHPESAQRHSQASGPVGSVASSTPVYNPPLEPREHYRSPVYARGVTSSTGGARDHSPATAFAALSPPYRPPDQPPGPPPPRSLYHEHARPSAPSSHPPPNYHPSGNPYGHPPQPPPSTSHSHYPQHRPYSEPDPYASVSRNQMSAYPGPPMNYTPDHDDPVSAVFLLMEDIRFGGPDFQLAEVNVSLRPHVGEEGGWWADGEEVMKALQLTTSRLEGAAKVFARRGKYRQCFMRFSEDGTMECQPSNLMVSQDRNIELIIEPNLENRTPLREPYMIPPSQHESYPRNYTSPTVGPAQPRTTYDEYGHYPQQSQSHPYPTQPYYIPPQNHNGKRNSAEASSTVAGEDHSNAKRQKTAPPSAPPSSKRAAHLRQQGSSQSRPSTGGVGVVASGSSLGGVAQTTPATRVSSPDEGAQEPISPYGPFQRYDSHPVTTKQPKEVVNAAIVAYLRSHIQKEEGYQDFASSKGRLLPIPDLLKGYRFATRIVNMWANRKTPPTVEGCPNKRITKNHVLQALFRQTSWGSDCEQTLQLADRYGPGGPREDPRVVEIMNGGSMLPEKSGSGEKGPGRSQGSVALLDFLKDVDREHKARQEEELRKSASSSSKDVTETGKGEGEGEGETAGG